MFNDLLDKADALLIVDAMDLLQHLDFIAD